MNVHIDFRGAFMFQQSIADLPSNNRSSVLASVGIQFAIAAALLAVPLLHPEVLTLTTPRLSPILLAPRPPKPPVHLQVNTPIATTSSAPTAPSPQAAAPTPRIHNTGEPIDQPMLAVGLNIGAGSDNPFATLGPAGPPSAVVVTGGGGTGGTGTGTSQKTGLLNLSTGVTAGLLLEPIQPIYPQIARVTHTEGTVILQAIISKSGRIESAHVLSGPIMLQASALEAVRNARYRPYLLNGQPTEVETTISINFRIGS